jgi:Leucine-rich repeat (LRR) protein
LESLDLHDLECMRGVSLKNLRDIQLSRNMVSNIDILNQYKNLETIDASNCYIEDVNFNLPKLVRLDLSNNYLRKFPILENMQRLVYLNLNSNKLVEFQSFHYE